MLKMFVKFSPRPLQVKFFSYIYSMEMNYTLLRIIRSVEDTAYVGGGDNSEEVKYEKPVIEVIEGGKTLLVCQEALTKIREEISFLTSLKQRKQDIYTKNKNKLRSSNDKPIFELEQELIENKSKDVRIEKLYLRNYNVWETIDERIRYIHGDYMIIPCYFEEIYSNVKND